LKADEQARGFRLTHSRQNPDPILRAMLSAQFVRASLARGGSDRIGAATLFLHAPLISLGPVCILRGPTDSSNRE
jgi:hypothetical protein